MALTTHGKLVPARQIRHDNIDQVVVPSPD